MYLNAAKSKVMYLGTKNIGQIYKMRGYILECSDSAKDLGVMEDTQLNLSSQCDVVAKRELILGCKRKNIKVE